MKKFEYNLGNIDHEILFILIFVYIMLSPFVFLMTWEKYMILFLFYILFTILFSMIVFLLIRKIYKPHIARYWIIDERGKRMINKYEENEEISYAFSDIERITYSHQKGSISIKLRNNRRSVYFMKISESRIDDFEREMKKLSEKYGFTFVVLWKKRDVEIGKTGEETVKEIRKDE